MIIVPSCKFSSENPRIFNYAELYITTKGFNKDELLGNGGFGSIFKVVLLSDGSIVAVKCISEKDERRLEKSFEAELGTRIWCRSEVGALKKMSFCLSMIIC